MRYLFPNPTAYTKHLHEELPVLSISHLQHFIVYSQLAVHLLLCEQKQRKSTPDSKYSGHHRAWTKHYEECI